MSRNYHTHASVRRDARRMSKGHLKPTEGDLTPHLTAALSAVKPYTPEEQQQPDPRHGEETRRRVRTARWRGFYLLTVRTGVFLAAALICAAFWAAVAWTCCTFFAD